MKGKKGLLPIDQAPPWNDYATAKDAARDAIERLADYERKGWRPLCPLNADQERRYRPHLEKKAALEAWLREALQRGELWGRPGSKFAKLQPIPAVAANDLQFDPENYAARAVGMPMIYDPHPRLQPAAPVKRWRKPPPTDVLKPAALAAAKAPYAKESRPYQPDDLPTAAEWKEALEAQLGE